jgi:hypothetical protein
MRYFVAAAFFLASYSSYADAALDFSAVTTAVDASTIVTAISALAAIKILPGVAKWGYNMVISWFRG